MCPTGWTHFVSIFLEFKLVQSYLPPMETSGTFLKTNNQTRDFKALLREILVSRCKNNPAYSLRAFAKQINIEPSFLSKLISGKRRATPAVIKKVSIALGLNPQETNAYINSAKTKVKINQSQQNFQNLALDHFTVISDWYHYGILELIQVEGFESDISWIAKKLGISKFQVKDALERLERLEMVQIDENQNYSTKSVNHTTVNNEYTVAAFKKLQKQILLQALDALDNTPFELRDQSSMTMAIVPELLTEAKMRIKNFRRELCTFLEGSGQPRKEVYQLSVSLFPITKNHL